MKTINQFDRSNLKDLRAEISAALTAVAQKHGISLEITNIRFSSNEFSTKLKAYTNTQSPVVPYIPIPGASTSPSIFNRSLIGKKFRFRGNEYTIADLKPSRPKYPVVGVSARGARYKFPENVLNNLIN